MCLPAAEDASVTCCGLDGYPSRPQLRRRVPHVHRSRCVRGGGSHRRRCSSRPGQTAAMRCSLQGSPASWFAQSRTRFTGMEVPYHRICCLPPCCCCVCLPGGCQARWGLMAAYCTATRRFCRQPQPAGYHVLCPAFSVYCSLRVSSRRGQAVHKTCSPRK